MQRKAGRSWVPEAFRAAACCCWTVAGVVGGRGCRHHASRRRETLGRSRALCSRTSLSPRQHREMGALASTTAAPHIRVPQNNAVRTREKAGVKPRIVDRAPGTLRRVARSGGEGHQARRHGARSTGARNRAHWARRARQAGGQMEPLHLAMMRALWIWRTHEMRLMTSCSQVARAC